MSEPKEMSGMFNRVLVFVICLAAAIYLIITKIHVVGNILLVLIGFGAVILIHEFGHFILAKWSDIKVNAFSIGFPPTLFGIMRTEKGWRIRILPDILKKGEGQDEKAAISFTIGKKAKAGETEYRIGLIPVGGFVGMLGQDDAGTAESSDDPRSFANKTALKKIGVIGAGVFFNAVSAIIIFMVAFLVGIKLPPAVVGGVLPDSPADKAGLKAGDEVIAINGKAGQLDFSNITLAAALSKKGEGVNFRVRHENGTTENYVIIAKTMNGSEMKMFGIEMARNLTIAQLDANDTNTLESETGLKPGDNVVAVDGKEVQKYWELADDIGDTYKRDVTLTIRRKISEGKEELFEKQIPLMMVLNNPPDMNSESQLSHIYSIVPRLKVEATIEEQKSLRDRIMSRLTKKTDEKPDGLKAGDIIVKAGEVANPTYLELRNVTTANENKKLGLEVLRKDDKGVERKVTVTAIPKRLTENGKVQIGIGIRPDWEHAIAAKTISAENGPAKLDIPRGAVITKCDGEVVSNFYDIIRIVEEKKGQPVMMEWRVDKELAGGALLELNNCAKPITIKSVFATAIPFEDSKRLYKAAGPLQAIGMGFNRTIGFIEQTYATLRSVLSGGVSPGLLTGPVGIVTLSYKIVAQQPIIYYVYFIGLISACIAVFNFLPMPPLDGGLALIVLIEKIKGSKLSERAQGMVAYVGWALIGTLFIYVTFNDILRIIKGFFG